MRPPARRLGGVLLCLGLGAGCVDHPKDGDPDSSGDPPDPPASACADGSWGSIVAPESAVHVRTDGDSAGAGSLDDPVDSLEAALTILRARGGGGEISIGPGRFGDTNAALAAGVDGAPGDDGVHIQGCAGDTTLVSGDDDLPPVKLSGVADVELADLRLDGGRGGLWIWQGAEARASRVTVTGTRDAAILIDGPDTVVVIEGLDVESPRPSLFGSGLTGVGVLVDEARLTLSDARITGATRYGVFVQGDGESAGILSLEGVEITDTQPSGDDGVGRAVSAQSAASVRLGAVHVSGAADAGVFLSTTREVVLDGVEVDAVEAGLTPGGASTGDGVVVTGVPADGSNFPPSLFQVAADGLAGSGITRAGLLLEHVEAEVGASIGVSAFAQGDAVLSGKGAAAVEVLGEGEELDLVRTEFDPSELVGP